MKTGMKIAIAISGALVLCVAYFVAVILFSLQTLVIENDSDSPITVEIYDQAWTVDADDRVVKRFQSDQGDAHFTIRDTGSGEEIGGLGYLTGGMSDCHTITISTATELDYNIDTGALCHLRNW